MTSDAEYSLSLSNIRFEREDIPLFSSLGAEFRSGDVVRVTGPNGAGKTTLLKVIAGLLPVVEGGASWCGKPAKGHYFYSSLLFLGHTPGIKSSLTPLENLNWYFGINGMLKKQGNKIELFNDALDKVGLRGYENVPCHQMSAGQQRRTALARLYCSAAPLWVLDEPFTAIDVQGVANLEALIDDHVKNRGIVLMTSHQPISVQNLKYLNVADFQVKDDQVDFEEILNVG